MTRADAAERWLAANDPDRRRARRGGGLIETRWDRGTIRVFFPRRSYRPEVVARLTPAEAEALARNLGRRLAERNSTESQIGTVSADFGTRTAQHDRS